VVVWTEAVVVVPESEPVRLALNLPYT